MSKITVYATAVMLIGGFTMALVGPKYPSHAHEATHFSAGEPGDPKKKSRTVVVTMREGEGKMIFIPDRIDGGFPGGLGPQNEQPPPFSGYRPFPEQRPDQADLISAPPDVQARRGLAAPRKCLKNKKGL